MLDSIVGLVLVGGLQLSWIRHKLFSVCFSVWPLFLWNHVPQLTFRSSRFAALAPQFTLHSSPKVCVANLLFVCFICFQVTMDGQC